MPEEASIFLTLEQAKQAVCRDFRQYEPQIILFSEIIRVLPAQQVLASPGAGKEGLWIRRPGDCRMRWLEGPGLIDAMCTIIHSADADPQTLAAVCSRVFRTRALAERDSRAHRTGLRIWTGMEDFRCRQCGRCCETLDYRSELTFDDVKRWKRLGRTDILEWVGVFPKENGDTVYRIWMKPGTREFVSTCPFLQRHPTNNLFFCRIHDVKPQICRQYPVSAKHAAMTGCPGFQKT